MYILLQNKEFCSILCIFGKTWLYIVLHDFNFTYYSSIILGSFSILLFPKLCWHIGLAPTPSHATHHGDLCHISMQYTEFLAGTQMHVVYVLVTTLALIEIWNIQLLVVYAPFCQQI